jgi:tripartite-type tricarboxylate transporter receptor subunit TctC
MRMKLLGAVATAVLSFNSQANAQKLPDRPMTMIIPFAAGGPTDVLGRVIAGRMSEVLGQQVVVENATGAGGMTGSARVAKSAPDGYQFVLGTVGSAAQGQTLYKQPLYNTVTDFTPVMLIAEVPLGARTALPGDGRARPK